MGINRRWGSWWLISCGHVHVGDMCGIGNMEGTLVTMVVAARELRWWRQWWRQWWRHGSGGLGPSGMGLAGGVLMAVLKGEAITELSDGSGRCWEVSVVHVVAVLVSWAGCCYCWWWCQGWHYPTRVDGAAEVSSQGPALQGSPGEDQPPTPTGQVRGKHHLEWMVQELAVGDAGTVW